MVTKKTPTKAKAKAGEQQIIDVPGMEIKEELSEETGFLAPGGLEVIGLLALVTLVYATLFTYIGF